MKLAKVVAVISAMLVTPLALSNDIELTDVIESIKLNHPNILAAKAKREQTEFRQQEAEGEFDLQLAQKSKIRTGGFYNGWYLDQSVTKPLEQYGANITARYRISDGSFPVYEDYFFTESGGEASLGLEFSLLKNRDIDKRRIGLQNADNFLDIGKNQEVLSINKLIYDGINAYLNWYQAYKQTQAIDELVKLALTRQKGLESRIANGDLAEISKTEFETTLLTRQASLLEAQQRLMQARQLLNFYWRDNQGVIKQLTDQDIPTTQLKWPFSLVNFDDEWREFVISQHPALAEVDANIRLAKNDIRLAKNNILPKLDIELKVSEDIGRGDSETLDGNETYFGVNFSVPLERRTARAKKSIAELKLSELEFNRKALRDRLLTDIKTHTAQLGALRQLSDLRANQAIVARKLERHEHKRFDAGDSDQFLLNARETQAGQAELDSIEAQIRWWRKRLDLVALSGRLLQ
ncbi:TolC family protein [Alteromonadaceae bacterium M269]|nr:TolC family protein [Alteromonadaceae bacterium M269]